MRETKYIQCFKSKDDNFRQNGQIFQTLATVKGALEDMVCPHQSLKIWNQPGIKESRSEIDPYYLMK